MLTRRCLTVIWSGLLLLATPLSVAADEAVDQALRRAQETGRPILAVAGREACALCQALHHRLSTEANLQPLLANYIPLELDVDGGTWQQWAQQFPVQGNQLPFVYIIRADGTAIYAASGSPQGADLPKLLQDGLQQAGPPLDARTTAKLVAAVETADRALADDDVSAAIDALVSVRTGGSFAIPALEAQKRLTELHERGLAAITQAQTDLQSPETRLAGALALVTTSRHYKRLPEVMKVAGDLKRSLRDADAKLALNQATALDKAEALVEQGKVDRAIESFRAVAEKHAGTEAETLANQRIADLESGDASNR